MTTAREAGAGTALVVGIVAAVVTVLLLAAPLALVLQARARASAAADAAALAAGDVALGVATGVPCERAAEVARSSGAVLGSCEQRGGTVRVTAVSSVLHLDVQAVAVAGPPGASRP